MFIFLIVLLSTTYDKAQSLRIRQLYPIQAIKTIKKVHFGFMAYQPL